MRSHGTAEVDMVSGLGGFIVLRDEHGIAKLPTQPPETVSIQ
jgi:hypothetical protein